MAAIPVKMAQMAVALLASKISNFCKAIAAIQHNLWHFKTVNAKFHAIYNTGTTPLFAKVNFKISSQECAPGCNTCKDEQIFSCETCVQSYELLNKSDNNNLGYCCPSG